MTGYTIQLAYQTWYGATVSVDADTVEEACTAAIDRADELDVWKSTDRVSDAHVTSIVEGKDGAPWVCDPSEVPIPYEYTEHGPPPVLTILGEQPPGAMRIEGGTIQLRFELGGCVVRSEMTDDPPPEDPPFVVVSRRPDGTPDISVRGGTIRLRVTGWDISNPPAEHD